MNVKLLPPRELSKEASHCLGCLNASCRAACPADVDIPAFIRALRDEDFLSAARILREKNAFAATCAYVCPVEVQCMGSCLQNRISNPVLINSLQRTAAETRFRQEFPPARGKRVAVIGGGVAGLAAAYYLRRQGFDVTLFEKGTALGGVVRSEIPRSRLPAEALETDLRFIREAGIDFKLGSVVGGPWSVPGFDAYILATGLSLHQASGLDRGGLRQITEGSLFLKEFRWAGADEALLPAAHAPADRANPADPADPATRTSGSARLAGQTVFVVGGGNVALDCALLAREHGAETVVFYRRGLTEMPVYRREFNLALEQGVDFRLYSIPEKYTSAPNQRIAVSVRVTKGGEADASGRRKPVPVAGSTYVLEADLVVEAISRHGDEDLLRGFGVKAQAGLQFGSDNGRPLGPVIVAGDLASGGATVVQGAAEGRQAAELLDAHFGR